GRAPPRNAGSSIPKNRATWAASPVSPAESLAPEYTATTGPPPRSGATTTSALPSPSRSAAATYTPPVNVSSKAGNEARVAPVLPAAGVTVTVRSVPDPPKTTPESGNRSRSEVVAVRTRFAAGVSASATVNAIAPVLVSSKTPSSGMSEMPGGVFGGGGG